MWAKQEKSTPQPFDVSKLADEVLDLISSSAPPKVRLSRSLASSLPAALANAADTRRIVLNLVVNAWQAIGAEPGEVCVTTGLTEEREAHVFVEVSDDGCGMSDETRLRIFDPFFTTRDEGCGLGLPMVARLVEKHGGRLEVWSEPGHGARFRVSLPLAPRA
jgi:signal transduction histidine kinase